MSDNIEQMLDQQETGKEILKQNKLLARSERLKMLIEEAGEIVQIGCKMLRHGWNSYHPNDLSKTSNTKLLETELSDLLAVLNEMICQEDLSDILVDAPLEEIWEKKLKWTHHQ